MAAIYHCARTNSADDRRHFSNLVPKTRRLAIPYLGRKQFFGRSFLGNFSILNW